MLAAKSANIRLALLNIQQRRYVDTLSHLEKEEKVKASIKRRPMIEYDGENS